MRVIGTVNSSGTAQPYFSFLPRILLFLLCASAPAIAAPVFEARESGGKLELLADDQPVATYVYEDPEIPRPYFAHVKTLDGLQVTRNHPPTSGDLDDHATYHPGIWLAFGDISGVDYWRNRAEVRHVKFLQEPAAVEGGMRFIVENAYLDGSNVVVREHCAYSILPLDSGWMLISDSEFRGLVEPAVFGDQEEMGFGVRVATPLTVERAGRILNSVGAVNEEAVWGKQAAWADYSGEIEGAPAGLTVLTHPKNFRESWFHARDYGLLLANPFGQNAFTQGEKSAVRVTAEEPLRLIFGVYVHGAADEAQIKKAYEQFVGLPEPEQKEP